MTTLNLEEQWVRNAGWHLRLKMTLRPPIRKKTGKVNDRVRFKWKQKGQNNVNKYRCAGIQRQWQKYMKSGEIYFLTDWIFTLGYQEEIKSYI